MQVQGLVCTLVDIWYNLDSWNARFGQFMERHKKKKLLMGYINEIKSLRMAEGKKETKEELQDLKCGEEQVELFSEQAGK